MKKKVLYLAPVVEVLDARVEKGFAGSGEQPDSPESNNGTERMTEGQSYLFS